MSSSFQADKATLERVAKCEESIQHWSQQIVQLEFQKAGILDTIRSLSAAKSQIVRQAVIDAGFPADKISGARMDTKSGHVEVSLKSDAPAEPEPG